MKITSSLKAHKHIKPYLGGADVEEVWAVALFSNKDVISTKLLFRGTVDRCIVHPRDIFRFAIQENASGFILFHNHPSGDASPSNEDIAFTKRIVNASELMQIPLIDHIIVNNGEYYSFADEGAL